MVGLFSGWRIASASFARGGEVGGGVVAGVSLQDHGGGAAESGELSVLGDAELWRGAGEHGGGHLLLDDRTKARPRGGEVAGDENDLRRERCGDETKAAAELYCLAADGVDRLGVAFFGEAEEVVNCVDAIFWRELGVVAQGRGGGGEDFPAAALAAAADGDR